MFGSMQALLENAETAEDRRLAYISISAMMAS
jgi:hypothetical protein